MTTPRFGFIRTLTESAQGADPTRMITGSPGPKGTNRATTMFMRRLFAADGRQAPSALCFLGDADQDAIPKESAWKAMLQKKGLSSPEYEASRKLRGFLGCKSFNVYGRVAKEKALAKFGKLLHGNSARLVFFIYMGPSDSTGNIPFANQESLGFEELLNVWWLKRSPGQHVVFLLCCPGASRWVDQMAALPEDRLASCAVQALDTRQSTLSPGAALSWFVQHQEQQPTAQLLPSPAHPQCSHWCRWGGKSLVEFGVQLVFVTTAPSNQQVDAAQASQAPSEPAMDQAAEEPPDALMTSRRTAPRGPSLDSEVLRDMFQKDKLQPAWPMPAATARRASVTVLSPTSTGPGPLPSTQAVVVAAADQGITSPLTSGSQINPKLLGELEKAKSLQQRQGRRGGVDGEDAIQDLLSTQGDLKCLPSRTFTVDSLMSPSVCEGIAGGPSQDNQGPLIATRGDLVLSPGQTKHDLCNPANSPAGGSTRPVQARKSGATGMSRQQSRGPSQDHSSRLLANPGWQMSSALSGDLMALMPTTDRMSSCRATHHRDDVSRKISGLMGALDPMAAFSMMQALKSSAGTSVAASASQRLMQRVLMGSVDSSSAGTPAGRRAGRTALDGEERSSALFADDATRWAFLRGMVGDNPELTQEINALAPQDIVKGDMPPEASMRAAGGSVSPALGLALMQATRSRLGGALVDQASPQLMMHLMMALGSMSSYAGTPTETNRRPGRTVMEGDERSSAVFADDAARWAYLRELVAGDSELEQEVETLAPKSLTVTWSPSVDLVPDLLTSVATTDKSGSRHHKCGSQGDHALMDTLWDSYASPPGGHQVHTPTSGGPLPPGQFVSMMESELDLLMTDNTLGRGLSGLARRASRALLKVDSSASMGLVPEAGESEEQLNH